MLQIESIAFFVILVCFFDSVFFWLAHNQFACYRETPHMWFDFCRKNIMMALLVYINKSQIWQNQTHDLNQLIIHVNKKCIHHIFRGKIEPRICGVAHIDKQSCPELGSKKVYENKEVSMWIFIPSYHIFTATRIYTHTYKVSI